MNRLKQLVYTPQVLRVLRALKLTEVMRNLHYKLARHPGGVYRTRIQGIQAAFQAADPAELVQVDWNLKLEDEFLGIVIRGLRAGDVFADIGANIGVFTILSALAVGERGQVVTFEPEAGAYAQLGRNITLNNLQNVHTFQVALSDENATGKLYLERSVGSLIVSENPPQEGEKYEEVEVVNGDAFWKLRSLPVPQVVKIDVEGAEYSVLRGLQKTLSNPTVRLVVCEVHPTALPQGTTPLILKEFVKSMGFDDVAELPRGGEIQMIARRTPSHATA